MGQTAGTALSSSSRRRRKRTGGGCAPHRAPASPGGAPERPTQSHQFGSSNCQFRAAERGRPGRKPAASRQLPHPLRHLRRNASQIRPATALRSWPSCATWQSPSSSGYPASPPPAATTSRDASRDLATLGISPYDRTDITPLCGPFAGLLWGSLRPWSGDAAGSIERRAFQARPSSGTANLPEAGSLEVMRALFQARIGVEAGVWTAADLLAGCGLAGRMLRVCIEPVEVSRANAIDLVSAIHAVLDRGKVGPCCNTATGRRPGSLSGTQ